MAWNDDGDQGPWGKKKPSKPSGNNNDGPDIDDLFKQGRANFNKMMGGGNGGLNSGFIALILVVGLILWGATGFYRVKEGEQAVILRFGEMVRVTSPGLRYHLPSPIERAYVVKVSEINVVRSGNTTLSRSKKAMVLRGENVQNLMLTGDENIIKLRFTVQWFIKDISDFLFNDPRPRETVKLAAESVVREVIAQTSLADALTVGKDKIIKTSKVHLQKLLDEYHIGIEIVNVNLEEVNPPDSVIDSFRDVQRARADRERKINEAKAYRNSILPVARGDAQKIIKAAEADREVFINTAEGEAARFKSVLREYLQAPDVTMTRLRIETSERVLEGLPKYIISGNASQGILPYLPLNKISAKGKN